jgi:DNA invertase Pin-like site-specific DNA recombinase
VALNHVGVILGVEMSRLARSCKDWYQLLELCALFGTLICDLDGLYDPSSYNDRLLLGLKGTMSEAELHILQQRMQQGSRQKALRGELVSKVPIGYVRDAQGKVSLDPDEQVQAIVRLIFAQFERIGTVAGVLRFLLQQGIQMPLRADHGPEKDQLQWRRPNHTTLRNLLAHPMYAGAYVYGRTFQNRRGRQPRSRPLRLPSQDWQVLLRDHYPAYITWNQYQGNLAQMAENRSRAASRGTVRRGAALLAGLVVCGRCEARMMTRYAGKASQPRYCCETAHSAYGDPRCQSLAARALDDEVVRLLLLALAPSALEVSLQVAADLTQQNHQAIAQWQQRLERAQYEAERARRQYDAVEPENRLVARTLEAAWEDKLRQQRDLTEQHERFLQQQPRLLTAEEQEQIRGLATDLPSLWGAAATTDADRKDILRQVIDKVVVNTEGDTEWVEVRIHWAGGHQTYTRLRRPVARMEQLSSWPILRRCMLELRARGLTTPEIVKQLNHDGLRNCNQRPLTCAGVRTLLRRQGLVTVRRDSQAQPLASGEWFLPELAQKIGVSCSTVVGWIKRGRVMAKQIGGPQGRWIIQADSRKIDELLAGRRNKHH